VRIATLENELFDYEVEEKKKPEDRFLSMEGKFQHFLFRVNLAWVNTAVVLSQSQHTFVEALVI
jgi:hypothetical protein